MVSQTQPKYQSVWEWWVLPNPNTNQWENSESYQTESPISVRTVSPTQHQSVWEWWILPNPNINQCENSESYWTQSPISERMFSESYQTWSPISVKTLSPTQPNHESVWEWWVLPNTNQCENDESYPNPNTNQC